MARGGLVDTLRRQFSRRCLKSRRDLRIRFRAHGGYFRAMIDRAVEGSLHLEKSLFGLADGAFRRSGGKP